MEIGVVEIKPFNTPAEKVEEDRVRLAEISKKMLHKRILAAKSEKELVTFAIMISVIPSGGGMKHANKYTFQLVKKSILPTFPSTFSNISLSLESLTHFKVRKEI
ncbi:hypothetical protein CLU79DRAFT_701956 [Phycomyces nitens]|nr:hypothetical protein CLU79DRAFT_701956 [Phycomyces nitens]